jgi:hypothetical protein
MAPPTPRRTQESRVVSVGARVLLGSDAAAIPLHGAPGTKLAEAMKPPGEWNPTRITRKGNTVTTSVNDIESSLPLPKRAPALNQDSASPVYVVQGMAASNACRW